MIFWIILILTIGSIVWWILSDAWAIAAPLISTTMIICFIVSLLILTFTYTNVDGFVAENTAKYETLVYQYENEIYENDNDLGKRDLMVDIQNWNEDLVWHKAMQNNFWLGIYIPDVFDRFETIEYERLNRGVEERG